MFCVAQGWWWIHDSALVKTHRYHKEELHCMQFFLSFQLKKDASSNCEGEARGEEGNRRGRCSDLGESGWSGHMVAVGPCV